MGIISKIFVAVCFLLPSMAAANCVNYNFEPNPGSGFAGFGRFENSCSYQVVIRFRYSDGQTGLAGPLRPGQTERGYHGEALGINYTWCDFDASACSPSEIGSSELRPPEHRQFGRVITEMYEEIDRLFIEMAAKFEDVKRICRDSERGPSDCEQAAESHDAVFRQINALQAKISTATLGASIGDANSVSAIAPVDTASGNISDCFTQTFDYPEGPPDDPSQSYHMNNCGAPVFCKSKPAWEINGQETWAFRSYVGQLGFFGGAWSHSIILSTCTLDDSTYRQSAQR